MLGSREAHNSKQNKQHVGNAVRIHALGSSGNAMKQDTVILVLFRATWIIS